MKIDLTTLKRIAKATPELTIAEFVAVWGEKIEDQARERDRERHRKQPEMEPESDRKTNGNQPSREEQEKQLFVRGRQLAGKNAGGMVTLLLKAHRYDIDAVNRIFDDAQTKADPKEYIAAAVKRTGNGAKPSGVAAAFDELEHRADGLFGGNSAEMVDVTPRRD